MVGLDAKLQARVIVMSPLSSSSVVFSQTPTPNLLTCKTLGPQTLARREPSTPDAACKNRGNKRNDMRASDCTAAATGKDEHANNFLKNFGNWVQEFGLRKKSSSTHANIRNSFIHFVRPVQLGPNHMTGSFPKRRPLIG